LHFNQLVNEDNKKNQKQQFFREEPNEIKHKKTPYNDEVYILSSASRRLITTMECKKEVPRTSLQTNLLLFPYPALLTITRFFILIVSLNKIAREHTGFYKNFLNKNTIPIKTIKTGLDNKRPHKQPFANDGLPFMMNYTSRLKLVNQRLAITAFLLST
jgi:hypothetical protein